MEDAQTFFAPYNDETFLSEDFLFAQDVSQQIPNHPDDDSSQSPTLQPELALPVSSHRNKKRKLSEVFNDGDWFCNDYQEDCLVFESTDSSPDDIFTEPEFQSPEAKRFRFDESTLSANSQWLDTFSDSPTDSCEEVKLEEDDQYSQYHASPSYHHHHLTHRHLSVPPIASSSSSCLPSILFTGLDQSTSCNVISSPVSAAASAKDPALPFINKLRSEALKLDHHTSSMFRHSFMRLSQIAACQNKQAATDSQSASSGMINPFDQLTLHLVLSPPQQSQSQSQSQSQPQHHLHYPEASPKSSPSPNPLLSSVPLPAFNIAAPSASTPSSASPSAFYSFSQQPAIFATSHIVMPSSPSHSHSAPILVQSQNSFPTVQFTTIPHLSAAPSPVSASASASASSSASSSPISSASSSPSRSSAALSSKKSGIKPFASSEHPVVRTISPKPRQCIPLKPRAPCHYIYPPTSIILPSSNTFSHKVPQHV